MSFLLFAAAQLAVASDRSITIRDADLVRFSRDADVACPILFDRSVAEMERNKRFSNFLKEQGYSGIRLTLLSVLCTQWQKGYIEGARRGAVN